MTKYQRIKARAASERGTARALRRWEVERQRREAEARAVETRPDVVKCRVIVVAEPSGQVREAVLLDWHEWRDLKRVRRQVCEWIGEAAMTQRRAA